MIKRVTRWTQRPDMTRDEALRHWRQDHAPLVVRVPGVVRYVQNFCVPGPEGVEPPCAGLGEVWFETVESAQAALASSEWRTVLDDAATFMDMSEISAAWASEHTVR
jgi:uncharacterized protein (TIGR02118 family)